MSLGENIYKLRTDRRMSQGDLADALEVSRQSVSKWENDSAVPELEKLVKMSRLFGISLDELVSGEAPTPQEASIPQAAPSARLSRRQIVGITFAGFALLIILVFAISGGGFAGLIPAVPFFLCFGLCMSQLRHIVLWCVWTFVLPLLFTPVYEFIRIYEATLIMTVVWLGLLLFTLWCLRSDPVVLNKRKRILLILGYGLWFGYTLVRILEELSIWNLALISGRTIAYWVDVIFYLLFICLLSIITRLLKQKKT